MVETEHKILVVDDEADIRSLISGILEDEGYGVAIAENAAAVYGYFETSMPDLVILDIWLQNSDQDGIEILKTLTRRYPDLPIIMISGHGTIETAVSSIKEGAYDFIEKPFKSDRLILMIRRALEAAALRKENTSLRELTRQKTEVSLNGKSQAINTIRQIVERVAPTNSRVLITGEPGTGKENVARLIHKVSSRSGKALMVMNCAIMHPDHMEKELFGLEKNGEITHGLLEQANGGTLLFDEISDMPLETQGKIVRILQEQTFSRVGGSRQINVDIRFLASTNRDLEELINKGRFRKDLYYRLNVVPLHMPCLKDRIQDIPELVKLFASDIEKQSGLMPKSFTQKLLSALQSYEWPGNIRQLRNAVEWMMIMSGAGQGHICVDYLPQNLGQQQREKANQNPKANIQIMPEVMSKPLREAREEFERHYLLSQIKKFDGNISKTAKFVGMERSALHRKLKLLQVTNEDDPEVQGITPSKGRRSNAYDHLWCRTGWV